MIEVSCRHLTAAERNELQRWVRTRTTPQRLVVRSRIILLASEGHSVAGIARTLSIAPATVRLWCDRFQRRGVGALEKDAPGRGRPRGMCRDVVAMVLRAMASARPRGGRWTARSLAAHVGTSVSTVWRVWTGYGIGPSSSRPEIDGALKKVLSETPNLNN